MNKTPKKAAPGGDERNLHNRRLKATTAASKASETSSHKRQRDTENSNRPLACVLEQKNQVQRKKFKSKLRVPTKFELNRPPTKMEKPSGSSGKKKVAVAVESALPKSASMQLEVEEAEVKENAPVQEESTKESTKESSSKPEERSKEECVDRASTEPAVVSKEEEQSTNKESVAEEASTNKESASKEEQATPSLGEKDKVAEETPENKEAEDYEETDITLNIEMEDSPPRTQEEKRNDTDAKNESKEQEVHSVTVESKSSEVEKEDLQSESQTDTESYSENILESTTSELSEVSESAAQTEVPKQKEAPEEVAKDLSFVSYDPSIMLKDVQIKLNDCLKENSKLFDTSNVERSSTPQPSKDLSFGKTLRSLSGRRSLSRMRHVTLREHRYTPNNSLFVNTSSISLPPDDAADYKILRYSTGLSDTVSSANGTPSERKRKHDTDDWSSMKKQKAETENSLLHTSISLLKGLRRPIQVSTPVSEMKFEPNKLELADEDSPSSNEGTKKWCVVM